MKPTPTPDLLPCPFCGSPAHIEQRGDPRMSTIYQCDDCGCRLETGEERDYGAEWNRRAALEPVELQGIVAFERTYPDLFYKMGKGRLSPDEPMYGAIIEMADGEPIGEGESNVSLAAAFEAALADSELPIPAGYPTVSKQDVLQALDTLMRANGYDLDRWTGENLSFDELRDAYRHALRSEKP